MDPKSRLRDNPFFVLGLPPDAARAEIERTGQRLLAELELGRETARTYSTPLGPEARTADRVRAAVAELRDPARRLGHELWARLPAQSGDPAPTELSGVDWPLAARALGMRPPRDR